MGTDRKKVLLTEKIHPEAVKLLEEKAVITTASHHGEEALLSEVGDAFGIVLKSASRITRRIIETAPELKIISRTGAGYDNVDVDAATEHGIMVCNLPGVNTVSVAEHTMALIFALSKKLCLMDGYTRNGQWKMRSALSSMELSGKILGIVGLGKIGQAVMRLARGIGMKVIAYDPPMECLLKGEADFCGNIEELFRESDFISLNIPSLPETRRMVGDNLLGLMKPEAYLVNTSRGEVVDEEALVRALKAGRIAGAGLDVFGDEPVKGDNPLLNLSNVVLTPHIAGLTRESGVKMSIGAVEQVIDLLEGRTPQYIVNRSQLGL